MFVKPELLTQSNVRQSKGELKSLAALLTEEIQRRSGAPAGWDFRFFLPLAQWLIEQGGYTMTPEGNNPGNVVGTGDAGFFQRPDNHEWRNGVWTLAPEVKFAKYSSMKVATARKFDLLRDQWPLTYQTIVTGGSSDRYASGLYPGHGKDYATASQASYKSGMRFRLKQVVGNYILVANDDIKEIDGQAAAIPGKSPAPGESLDYRNDIGLNKNMRSVLENLLAALNEVQKRVNAGQGVQP
jgi:hypothetical protein